MVLNLFNFIVNFSVTVLINCMLFAGTSETVAEREDPNSANRAMKRKTEDQGLKYASFCNHISCHMIYTID